MGKKSKSKEGKILKKLRENPYIATTIVLIIFILILFGNYLINYSKEDKTECNLCNIISGTPAWIVNGKILGYGYKGNLSVDDLINHKVEFYYRKSCGFCRMQIEHFDDWEKYKQSGLTNECP
ncbi:hypothetical protein DRN69_08815 [Candidatus Pacearchaeota archaeon]|nr:MAG: hypothetical protein DRN69_08815 [Candidatus Pacearchaeota archaeon]